MEFHLWQNEDGTKSEPNPKQKLLWYEDMPEDVRKEFAHFHDMDVVAHSGTAGSGKTEAAIKRAIYMAKKYPGIFIMYGSINFKHLWKSVITQGFKPYLSTKYGAWKHPWVVKKPDINTKELIISTGEGFPDSTISFVNLTDPKSLLSTKANLVIIEEAQLLGSSEPLEILVTRMRGQAAPFRQIILNFNPDTEDIDWLWDWFKLYRYDPDYDGDRNEPVGKPCICQFCENCSLAENGSIQTVYENGVCPKCGWANRSTCPGNQYYQRVIRSSMIDNLKNLPGGFAADVIGTLSDEKSAAYGLGIVKKQPGGITYHQYGKWNETNEPLEIEPDRDLIWHLDFNITPQCSGISQIHWRNGLKHVYVKDEIVKQGNIDKIVKIFIWRYKNAGLQKRILLYGDPNGHKKADIDMFYRIKHLLDEVPEFKGRVQIMTPATQYRIENRVKSVNNMLKDEDGLVRIHFGPKAIYHRLSAAGTKWNNKSTKECDKNDIRAREKWQDGMLISMTHPMAGFGYWIVQEFPLVEEDELGADPIFASVNSGQVILQKKGNLVTAQTVEDMDIDPADFEDDAPDVDPDIEEEEVEEDPPHVKMAKEYDRLRKMPIASQLRQSGLWNLRSH
jgi:hypothetical protein